MSVHIRPTTATSLRAATTNSDPEEFLHKIVAKFGGLPVTLGPADSAALTTLKNAATTAAPFTECVTQIAAGNMIRVGERVS